MKKHSLSTTGLSMSQAQSISNLCNQRAQYINEQLTVVNNAEKTVTIGGNTYVHTVGKPLPSNAIDLLKEKAALHACQAFLMENIKAKDSLLKEEMCQELNVDIPRPEMNKEGMYHPQILRAVEESWGWEQLSLAEYHEYLEAEAYAAHIGKFIHKGSTLDSLRTELPYVKALDWISVEDGKKTPLKVNVHHKADDLMRMHESLAAAHRGYEQRVNYFKAKVKNLVSDENARIARHNADEEAKAQSINDVIFSDYQNKLESYKTQVKQLNFEFNAQKEKNVKAIAALRINVDARFQSVIDQFMDKI